MSNDIVNKHRYDNNQFFGKWAILYDYEKYFFSPLRKKAAAFLALKPPAKILDVATGTGAQAYELAKLGYDVTGIDLSPEMLNRAKMKIKPDLRLSFRQADATKLPFRTNSFDASSVSLALHDMPYEIDILVLKEMKRVTKNNGEILIVDYMEPGKHWVAKLSHPLILLYETPNYAPFIRRGLDAILKDAGLRIKRTMNFLGLVQIIIVLDNK